jgi:hypothetical protein
MSNSRVEHFKQNWDWVHRMTIDFVDAVPDDKWDFTPDPPRGDGTGGHFGPFSRQLRHVIRVRGVYIEAMKTKKADFPRGREHYRGSLTRDALRLALSDSHTEFLATLDAVDTDISIDFGGTAFSFDNFTYEVVQHESIHHGQWSVYAALGRFATPRSWQTGWKL